MSRPTTVHDGRSLPTSHGPRFLDTDDPDKVIPPVSPLDRNLGMGGRLEVGSTDGTNTLTRQLDSSPTSSEEKFGSRDSVPRRALGGRESELNGTWDKDT